MAAAASNAKQSLVLITCLLCLSKGTASTASSSTTLDLLVGWTACVPALPGSLATADTNPAACPHCREPPKYEHHEENHGEKHEINMALQEARIVNYNSSGDKITFV